jgi:hypothetical protein
LAESVVPLRDRGVKKHARIHVKAEKAELKVDIPLDVTRF